MLLTLVTGGDATVDRADVAETSTIGCCLAVEEGATGVGAAVIFTGPAGVRIVKGNVGPLDNICET